MEEKNFAELDANFKSREIGSCKLEFYDGFASPFVLEGFPYIDPEGRRSRLPLNIAAQCDMPGVYPMSMQNNNIIKCSYGYKYKIRRYRNKGYNRSYIRRYRKS